MNMAIPIMSKHIEDEFKTDLLNGISSAEDSGIRPFSAYRKLIKNNGSYDAAIYLLKNHDLKSFTLLCKSGLSHCTIESFIVSDKYSPYFTPSQLKVAQDRLDSF